MTTTNVVPEWTLADRLRKARLAAEMDQGELAERIGVARNTVGNYELGATRPRRIVLNAWALATGVPVEWLEAGEAPSPGDDRQRVASMPGEPAGYPVGVVA